MLPSLAFVLALATAVSAKCLGPHGCTQGPPVTKVEKIIGPRAVYECNPGHSYPNDVSCVSTNGGLALVTPSATPSTTYACNPAHSYPGGVSCVSTGTGLALVTPTGNSTRYTTVTATKYTTYCSKPTVITKCGKTSTVTRPKTVTFTGCPCTTTKPVKTWSVYTTNMTLSSPTWYQPTKPATTPCNGTSTMKTSSYTTRPVTTSCNGTTTIKTASSTTPCNGTTVTMPRSYKTSYWITTTATQGNKTSTVTSAIVVPVTPIAPNMTTSISTGYSTTYCPSSTTFTNGNTTYSISTPTTLTLPINSTITYPVGPVTPPGTAPVVPITPPGTAPVVPTTPPGTAPSEPVTPPVSLVTQSAGSAIPSVSSYSAPPATTSTYTSFAMPASQVGNVIAVVVLGVFGWVALMA
ncbi:hypothetical protein LTR95_011347 [Oleoguttula sp. CCFEE 5521]